MARNKKPAPTPAQQRTPGPAFPWWGHYSVIPAQAGIQGGSA